METSANLPCLFDFVEANDAFGLEQVLSSNQFTPDHLYEERQGETALHRAAELDRVEILRALTSAGGDRSIVNIASSVESGSETPLHCAAAAGSIMCINFLMHFGANLDACNSNGKTPEDVAKDSCVTHIREIKQQLREIGHLRQGLLEAQSVRDFQELFHVEVDPDVKKKAMTDCRALLRACQNGSIEEVDWLVMNGMTPIPEGEGLESALHVACKTPDADEGKKFIIVQTLLKHFLSLLDRPGLQGNRPLHYAAAAGNSNVVGLLLKYYKAVWFHFNDLDDQLALPEAIETLAAEYYSGISEPELNINEQRDDQKTALHLALSAEHDSVVRVMVEFSVQMSGITEITDDLRSHLCNNLMIDFATVVQSGHLASVEVLLKHNQCLDMSRALKEAFAQQHKDIIALLLLELVARHCTIALNEINWQGQNLPYVTQEWIIQAAEQLARMKCIQVGVPVDGIHSSLSRVTHLDLSQNQLTSLPIEVFFMTGITTLTLESNELTSLFDSELLSSAKNASETPQSKTKTDTCTISAKSESPTLPCQKLEKLFVRNNKLTALPCELFDLPELKTLSASQNCIKQLPDNFWLSSSLEVVHLVNNKITQLPGPYGDYLVGAVGAVGAVPQEIHLTFKGKPKFKLNAPCKGSNLQGLGSLTSQSNGSKLEEGYVRYVKSDCWKRKRSFDSLDEQTNGSRMALLSSLEEWEEEVGYILPREVFSQERIISAVSDKLESSLALSQRKQKMSVQTSTVVSLASCDSLDGKAMIIGETGQSIPGGENTLSPAVGAWSYSLVKESADEFDSCFEKESHCKGSPLTELNLSRNKLKSLPFALPCLAPNLKRLNISSNEFEELDPVAMLPQSLVYLNANSNSIANMRCTRRAKECCAKAKVNSLGTQPCQHQCHNTLPNLSGLCLRDNQLVRVELLQAKRYETEGFVTCKREVLFPSLMRLELRKNKLTTFPPDVAYLKELTSLDVSNNKDINRLPDDITQLPNLSHLPLDGLDLIDFPQTEMNQGAKRIQNFLRHRQDGEKPYRRMKLMVVGLAKKGKTTLVHRLVEYDSLKRTLKQTVKRILKRRHPPDSKPCQQTRSETVGIDITEMEYRPSKGKYSKEEAITFRIWDFAGQEKYYATHQCFLTRHSMYLVLWNLKDGTEGIENLASWLYNIEACAPGSPILIVGTHLDEVDRHDHHKLIAELERKYIFRGLGFPNVVGHIEVALVKRPGHVDNLCQKLFEVACEMRYSHDKTEGKPLLQQSFPASYMWLEKAVTKWRTERNNENRPPVITTQEFFELLEAKVSTDEGGTGAKCLTENKEELDHATRFLHDNGVLMNYYNDPVLKDLYFIDPNWLCEMAAKVVGKEANPYTKNGVLDISNLQQLFQGDEFPLCLQKYIALLEKFEVALRIDGDRLLIPSVLPETANEAIGLLCESLTLSCSVEFASSNESPLDVGSTPQSSMETRSTVQPTMSNHHVKDYQFTTNIPQTSQSRGIGAGYRSRKSSHSSMVGNKRLPRKLYRIYLIPFHPSGFWPRLVSRIRIDQSIQQTINQLIKDCGFEVKADAIQWKCWRRGLCMKICDVTVLSLEGYPATNLCNKWQDKHSDGKKTEERTFSIEIDGKNSEVKSSGEYCVEISVALSTLMIMLTNQQYPANSATVHSPMTPGHLLGTERSGRLQISPPALKPQMSPETFYSHGATSACPTAQKVQSLKRMLPMTQQVANRESAARHKLFYQMAAFLLSKSAYHIDTLLECWYEGLHSSESIEEHSTVKRIIPCLHCIAKANSKEPVFDSNIPPDQPKLFPFSEYPSYKSSRTPQSRLQQHPAVGGSPSSWIRKRFQPSGELTVVPKSSSDHGLCTQVSEKGQTPNIVRYVSLSSCIAHVYMASGGPQTIPLCSQHEEAIVSLLAPDVEFQDLFNSLHVRKSMVVQGMQLGEGGYGSVFQGYRISAQGTGVHDPQDGIAIKTFDQVLKHNPVADVAQAACLLYYTARAEVSIMMSLDHPNVLPLCGLCVNPLWLLTPRAPGGDLSSSLKEYRKNNLQILPLTLREVLIQIASGMEHIHEQNIIYHDLRPDNVLVWKFPPPGSDEPSEVCVKIADYGISQFVSSFGIKPGKLEGNHAYLAPEIVQYGGKEAYSKKADVFTYGLLIYQLLTLQKPYQGIDCGVIGRYLRGERPTVPVRCRRSFFSIHTLKQWCWTQDPTLRPQLSQVLEFLKSECFLRLVHHLPLTKNLSIMTGCAVNREKTRDDHNDSVLDYGQYYFEAWVSTGQGQISIVEYQDKKITVSVPLECSSRAHTMCAIRDTVWVGTEQHGLFVFSNSVPKRKLLLQRWPIVDSEADDFDHLDAQDAKRILAIVHDEVRKSVIVSVPDQTLLVFKDEVDHRADRESACLPMSNSQLRLLTRHNMADSIYCVTIVNQNDVWAGLDNGRIAILDAQSLMSQGKQNIIKMRLKISNPRPEETNFVKFLVTDGSGNESKKFVWCGLHGSRVVHQWDAATQQEAGHIDCFSVLWKEDVSDRDSRVTSMLVHAGYLFVGTGSGHVVVVAIPSMQILTTMLPHSGEVRCLIPFQPALPHQMSVKTNEMLDDSEPFSPNASSAVPNCALQQIRRAAVLSCGLGLYGLTKQGSVHYPPDVLPVDKNDGHMLLWLADNWTT